MKSVSENRGDQLETAPLPLPPDLLERDDELFSFSLLIDPPSVDMLEGPPSATEVIDQASSSWPVALSRAEARELIELLTSGGFRANLALLQDALREALEDAPP